MWNFQNDSESTVGDVLINKPFIVYIYTINIPIPGAHTPILQSQKVCKSLTFTLVSGEVFDILGFWGSGIRCDWVN